MGLQQFINGQWVRIAGSIRGFASSIITVPPTGQPSLLTAQQYLDWLNANMVSKTQRVVSLISSATPSIDTALYDCVSITAQAEAITSMTSGLTGSPTDFQRLTIRIKDDGVARAITWGSGFKGQGATLPAITVAGKTLTVGFLYNSVDLKWGCIAACVEA